MRTMMAPIVALIAVLAMAACDVAPTTPETPLTGGQAPAGDAGTPPPEDGSASDDPSAQASPAEDDPSAQASPTTPIGDADITVDTSETHQTIDGFGAALPMWVGSADGMLTTDEIHALVGMGDDELGLSILRTMLGSDPNSWAFAVDNLREAESYGDDVRFLASPWSAPASMKTNNSTVGGELAANSYGAYADHLNDYVAYMDEQGVDIDVVSVQNEPDIQVDYESMEWTGEQIRDFVRDHGATITGANLMAAESFRFDPALTDPTLDDPAAAEQVDIIGGHLYGAEASGFLEPYPAATALGKRQWMTEWLSHEADGDGAAIWGDAANAAVWDETLDVMAHSVHQSMEVDWSAYIWWWARRYYSLIGDGEAAFGTQRGQVLKRGVAFSQYAKFVRPGYVRVGVQQGGAAAPLEVTAYQGDDQIVLVMLNRGDSAVQDAIVEVPQDVAAAEYYVTSQDRSRESAPVEVGGGQVAVDVDARSISTVVIDL